jgi:uncharacterized protein (DUF433 family)
MAPFPGVAGGLCDAGLMLGAAGQVRISEDDPRVSLAIATKTTVMRLTGVKRSTAYYWANHGLVHTVSPRRRGWPTIPLAGLAEYKVLTSLRSIGLSMPEVLGTAQYIREHRRDPYALLSKQLVTDGVHAFVQHEASDDLYRVVGGQRAFRTVLQDYLKPLIPGTDGFVYRYLVEEDPRVVIDPEFNGGRMMFESNSVPVFAVMGLLRAGESNLTVADEYELEVDDVRWVETNLSWLAEAA